MATTESINMPKYVNLSIHEDMANRIQRIIDENPELGYSSIADFIKSAIREYPHFDQTRGSSSQQPPEE